METYKYCHGCNAKTFDFSGWLDGLCDSCYQKVEDKRSLWEKIAKENGWYQNPFYVQVWFDDNGNITDSVSHGDLKGDIIAIRKTTGNCLVCGRRELLDKQGLICPHY